MEAEQAVKELQRAGIDMKKLSVAVRGRRVRGPLERVGVPRVGLDFGTPEHAVEEIVDEDELGRVEQERADATRGTG